MNYLEKLKESAKKNNSIVCMGLDPVTSAMPDDKSDVINPMDAVSHFFNEIFLEMKEQNVLPGAFKPNQGFYLGYDHPRRDSCNGSKALAEVLAQLEDMFPGTPVILDYKRGDIAKSSANYAKEGFDAWEADAVTVAPYMGTDSVMPFAEYCKNGKGVYVLNRTSNKVGAKDFQSLQVIDNPDSFYRTLVERITEFVGERINEGKDVKTPEFEDFVKDTGNALSKGLYEVVANKIVEWAQGNPGVGAVVGATSLDELSDLAKMYAGKNIPLLIPGVGKKSQGGQGGDASEVTDRLRDAGYDLNLARINSSSGLTHPWAKNKDMKEKLEKNQWKHYAKVCVAELNKLNEQIAYKP